MGEKEKTFFIRDWSVGELNALLKKIGEENARGILNGTMEVRVVPKTRKYLRLNGAITLPALTNPPDPAEFFQTRKGLFIRAGFQKYILAVAHKMEFMGEMQINSFDLVELTADIQIYDELSGDPILDVDHFCAFLPGLLEKPKNDEAVLSAEVNKFYVYGVLSEVIAVDVDWDSSAWEWGVDACPLDVNRSLARGRVFSPTADSLFDQRPSGTLTHCPVDSFI